MDSPLSSVGRRSEWYAESTKALTKVVLETMAQQAAADAKIEDSKGIVSASCGVVDFFDALDRFQKGFVSDTDLWKLSQDCGGQLSFSNIVALVYDMQLRYPRSRVVVPGRLSLRELSTLVLPMDSVELKAIRATDSDAEARSALYLLKNSVPCPDCGIRIQRSGDCAGCPNVKCSVCGCSFRCFCVVSDYGMSSSSSPSAPLSATSTYHAYRLVEVAARAAMELEHGRKRLLDDYGYSVTAISDVFNYLADARPYFTLADLRRSLCEHYIFLSDLESNMLWRRYAPDGAPEVSFPDFNRQLKAKMVA